MEISAFDLGHRFFKAERFPKWKQLKAKYADVKIRAGERDKSTRGVAKSLLIYASGKAFFVGQNGVSLDNFLFHKTVKT